MTTGGGLPRRMLGRTGLEVTMLGYGAMALDQARMAPRGLAISDEQSGQLLNEVLDCGINFIDTSPDYGSSEELIGRFISQRRPEYFIATKCGCPVDVPDGAGGGRDTHVYARANIVAGVEQSLRRMRTDYLDVVEFHGAPSARRLAEGDAVEALVDLRQQGKVRWIGVSSALPLLPGHIAMGVFDVLQIPYSAPAA